MPTPRAPPPRPVAAGGGSSAAALLRNRGGRPAAPGAGWRQHLLASPDVNHVADEGETSEKDALAYGTASTVLNLSQSVAATTPRSSILSGQPVAAPAGAAGVCGYNASVSSGVGGTGARRQRSPKRKPNAGSGIKYMPCLADAVATRVPIVSDADLVADEVWSIAVDERSEAVAAKHRFREALRSEFMACASVQALESLLALIRQGMQRTTGIASIDSLIKMAGTLRRPSEPSGDPRRTVFWQVVNQEAQHRRFALGIEAQRQQQMMTPRANGRGRSPLANGTSKAAAYLANLAGGGLSPSSQQDTRTTRAASQDAFGNIGMSPVHREDTHHSIVAVSSEPRKSQRGTQRQFNVFNRAAKGGRIHRSTVPTLLSLCGLPKIEDFSLIEDAFAEVCHSTQSAAFEDFLQVKAYCEKRLRKAYKQVFDAADVGGGLANACDLAAAMPGLCGDGASCVFNAALETMEVEDGLITFDQFLEIVAKVIESEGFSRATLDELQVVFSNFGDLPSGTLELNAVADVLEWLGFECPREEIDAIFTTFFLNDAHMITFSEFLKLMRHIHEKEKGRLRQCIQKYDTDGSGTISVPDLVQILESLNFFPNVEAVTETTQELGCHSDLNLDELIDFMKAYRVREGLTAKELQELQMAITRYASEGSEEMPKSKVLRAMRWLGYVIPYEVMRSLMTLVCSENNETMKANEMAKLVRLYWNGEVARLRTAFMKRTEENVDAIPPDKAVLAFYEVGYVNEKGLPPPLANEDLNENGCVTIGTFVQTGIKTKKMYRLKYKDDAGFSAEEVEELRLQYIEYDIDNSGDITMDELGLLIRKMFPTVTEATREELAKLDAEIRGTDGRGSIDFDDFIRVVRMFHNIMARRTGEKEWRAVTRLGFNEEEVLAFRELFCSAELNASNTLPFAEARRMVSSITSMGKRSSDLLSEALRSAKELGETLTDIPAAESFKRGGKPRRTSSDDDDTWDDQDQGSNDTLDFAEFLILMSELVKGNFADVCTKSIVAVANEASEVDRDEIVSQAAS